MFSRQLRLVVLACIAIAIAATQSIEAHQLRASEGRYLAAKKTPSKGASAKIKSASTRAGAAPKVQAKKTSKTNSKKTPKTQPTGSGEVTNYQFTVADCGNTKPNTGTKSKNVVPQKAGAAKKSKKKLRMLKEEAAPKKKTKQTSQSNSIACTAKLTPIETTGKTGGATKPSAGSKKTTKKTGKAGTKTSSSFKDLKGGEEV